MPLHRLVANASQCRAQLSHRSPALTAFPVMCQDLAVETEKIAQRSATLLKSWVSSAMLQNLRSFALETPGFAFFPSEAPGLFSVCEDATLKVLGLLGV
jgi:hypothetical protein